MSEVRPRVTGTEIEWSVGLRRHDRDYFDPADYEQVEDMVKIVAGKYGNGRSHFLINGAKCYCDDENFEYATDEEDSVRGTVAAEIAGEMIADEAVAEFIAGSEKYVDYQLLKRVQHGYCTTGYHMNYCVDATALRLAEEDLYELALWAGTVSMFTGAGCLYRPHPEQPMQFAIGQRALSTRYGFKKDHTVKPLISLRDQPLADTSRFHRISVVGLDPNIVPWASWMQLITGSLCLRSLEQGIRNPNLRLRSVGPGDRPLARLARAVATNPKLDTIIQLDDHSTIKAVDIEWELFKSAQQTEHTNEEAEGLDHWEQALQSIEGDRKFLRNKTGWMIRQDRLAKYATKQGLTFDSPDLMQRDRKWDDTRKGMARIIRPVIGGEFYDTDLIEQRLENACPDTRASLRGQAVLRSRSLNYGTFDWNYYQVGKEKWVHLDDPLITSLPETQEAA